MTDYRKVNDELYLRVTSGDESAKNEMIEANLPLCTYKVKAFLFKCPEFEHLEDELFSAASLALCEAVRSMAKAGPREGANPSAYLSTAVQRAILNAVDVECEKPESELIEEPEDDNGTNLLDKILACAVSESERQIVMLRAEGLTDNDISSRLGISSSAIHRTRKEIEARFDLSA